MGNKPPFEDFIHQLLAKHDRADALRAIVNADLNDSVNQILLEAELDSYFVPKKYDEEEQDKLIDKLDSLWNKIKHNNGLTADTDILTVELVMLKVDEGYGLSKDMMVYLNKLNKRY